MAHRFIIDDSTGALYSDFTCRRLTSAADILKSERGLSPTLEIYLVNVATDTRAVTGQTLTNADLDIILGSAGKMPDEGIIKIAWNDSGTLYQSGYVDVKNLSDDAIAAAFNSVVSPVTDAEGINVDNIGEGKWLLTMKKVGAISGNPTFDVEGCNPPSAIEVSSVRTGDSDTKGQWIISIAQSPVASISGGSFSAVTSGSFSGLTASISLNTTAMIASISRGIKDFELSITHSNQLLHRSPVSIHESLDPTTAGTLIISSPSLFTLGSNAVNQGETIALSGGLTYDGTTLAAPFLPLAGGTMTGNAVFNDGVKAIFGTASDGIELYHASNESYIDDSGTGRLFIRSNGSGVFLQKTDGENLAKFKTDGATELYFDGSKKIESTNLGCTISGKLIVNGDLDVSGTTTTFNSTVVTVDDPVFTVGGDTAPDASDNKDRGIEFRYFRSGESAKVGFFGYDNSENAFTFLTDATNNSEVFSGTLGNLKVGSITGTNFYATQIRTENGSASFPSHSFTNDSDTGIFKAAGNTLAFSTGGTEAARFDSLGRLGINTQSPLGLLEISTSNVKTSVNAGADELILQNDGYCGLTIFSNSTSAGQIIFGDETSDVAGAIQYFNSDDSLRFKTNGTEAARFDSSGCLGINKTSNLKGKLDVGGVSYFGGGSTSGHTQDETDAALVLQDNFYIYSENGGGYLRNIIGKASTGPIIIGEAGTSIINEIRSYAGEAGLYTWHQGTTETMRLNSTGLGIGGTPNYPLVVKSTSASHQVVAVNRPDSDTAALFLGNNSGLNGIISANNSDLLFGKDFGNTFFEGFRLDTNGHLRVGNGTRIYLWRDNNQNYLNYNTWLATTGAEQLIENNGTGGIHLKASGTNADIVFSASDGTLNEIMRLDGSTGNVGIGGVTSPSARLEITTASQGDTALQVGFTNSTPNLLVGTSTGSTKLEIANGNYHHKFYSRNASGTAVERLAIEGGSDTADIKIINSNLGIGTTLSLIHI